MKPQVVIIGAGHGGVQVAASLREAGFDGTIVLLSDEQTLPYQKPPLSKGYLQGKQTDEAILFRSPAYYDANGISLRLGVQAAHILPEEKQVITGTGERIPYTQLVLATGAANRLLRVPGADAASIGYLRNLTDARRIGERLAQAQRVAIIGGGFIGLELAALAVEKGKQVTVIEAQQRLMERVLPAMLSDVFQAVHERQGVSFFLKSGVEAIEAAETGGHLIRVSTGQTVAADCILAGIGVIPETTLAMNAGIACENGILVNEYQQTSVPDIYAIGDCANHHNPYAGCRLRLESVQNAVDQAKTAVAHMVGHPVAYQAVPWFWTNQYHLKLQMAGLSAGYDQAVVRGDAATEKFSVYYYKNGRLTGVDSLNRPADHLNARKLLGAGITPDPAQLADTAFNLNNLLA